VRDTSVLYTLLNHDPDYKVHQSSLIHESPRRSTARAEIICSKNEKKKKGKEGLASKREIKKIK